MKRNSGIMKYKKTYPKNKNKVLTFQYGSNAEMFKEKVTLETVINQDNIIRIFPPVYFVVEESTPTTFFSSPSDTSASLPTESSPEEASAKLTSKKSRDKWICGLSKGKDYNLNWIEHQSLTNEKFQTFG